MRPTSAPLGVVPGTVYLFICRDFKHVLLLSSPDGGATWRGPRDLTAALFPTGRTSHGR